ncbi:uncharacterized protein LOC117330794 isoform X2 [Pecten maximus]|uniref:uncharacterized protein LOC117330794 isoform X2 n=1 Tax=Pecten maximus TaxID=6579 RepID=UPI0014583C30|nr:uncharacterized protein LOC117330794 isoform X2 [Pecten maximus]
MVKRMWKFKSMEEVNTAVNMALKTTMFNERCRRWEKVIGGYRHLLWMIDRKHFPEDYEPPATIQMFMYEMYYHLAVAYQHVGKHKQAITELTNAIDIVSIPKNGCLAGCMTNSCLMTPIYARRAFAHAKSGGMVLAKKDAEKTVVLDSRNPDVYCIRALVHSANDNERHAKKDLELALNFNPTHNCTLMLLKALNMAEIIKHGADPNSYTNVNSFTHPCMVEFFDKMLFGLSLPHTVTQVDLTPDKPSKKSMENEALNRSQDSRPSSSRSQVEPFRCGTPVTSEQNKSSLRRRKDYGAALRKHLARPETSADFFENFKKERRLKAIQDDIQRRAASADARSRVQTSSSKRSHEPRVPAATKTTNFEPQVVKTDRNNKEKEELEGSSKKNAFIMNMPTSYTIPVFQATNIKEAPRMYYKPWKGDKLPVAELIRRQATPVFY